MLDIEQIISFYPEYLKPYKKNLLREYIQYKILEIIFDSRFGESLSFMGGTSIHIVHSNPRFSEDLDFDNTGLKKQDFEEMTELIQKRLSLEGYRVEKMIIEIDVEPQRFYYQSEKVILNKFDVFIRINVVPVDILLAQKLLAILRRKRALGRDFYDAIYLFGKTSPNLMYLKSKLRIKDAKDLKKLILKRCSQLDFKRLAKDVEPFLFIPGDAKKLLFFCDYIKDLSF
ncbi:MAG: hypothetical protein B5M53_11915 [Candidatus Cloacimonas sp. 4484_209]|nr:MAG: hypothetical protein B5M53_11915 [Candidatus Cloacimonas sp. 4484_209]